MKPLLVSLVLLLFALCRPSSATVASWTSTDTVATDSSIAISGVTKKKYVDGGTPPSATADQKKQLGELLGNTLYSILFDKTGKYDTLPAYYKAALENGVLCEFTADLEKKINQILYGADVQDATQRAAEVEAVKKEPFKVDCSATNAATDHPCFCGATPKAFLYCLAEERKKKITATVKTCPKKALDNLKRDGPTIWKMFDHANPDSDLFKYDTATPSGTIAEQYKELTKNEDAEMAKMYCELQAPAVTADLKDVYTADAMYWSIESVAFEKMSNVMEAACKNATINTMKPMDCICNHENGFVVCVLNFMSKYMSDKGYLECGSDPKKFIAAKQPTEFPVPKMESGGGGGSSDKPGNPTPAPASEATTSSLLMVPLAAAAVMLARV